MSYLVLARKYRPQSFTDVVGQIPVVKTLQNSILKQRVAHAILFSGVRGVGKTTLARIMAKAINCEGSIESPPCNNCRSCKEITQGSAFDLHEIDGASNRGIQEIRDLKEKIRFLPSSSKQKIIIIDEVHMLTTEAFNALLKTLEEPPEHVFFMFATTELHKIPVTILSRCQRYELKRVTASALTRHFQKISDAEKVEIEPAALALIVREAEGSVRDGLSLLDQMFSFGDSHISHEDVVQVLGLTDRSALISITRALLSEDRTTALQTLNQAFDYGIDIKRFTTDLLQCFRTLLLVKIGECTELIDLPGEEIELFKEIAAEQSFETIHSKFSLLIKTVEELRFTSQPRLTLETAFLKIIETGNIVPVSTLLGKVENLLNATVKPQQKSASQQIPPKKKSLSPETPEKKVIIEEPPPPPPPRDQLSRVNEQQESLSPKSTPLTPPVADTEENEQKSQLPKHDVRRDWDDFMIYIKERKIWMAQDLQRSTAAKEVGSELYLHYSDPANCALLREKENKKLLTEFVLDFFQKDLTVRFIIPDFNGNGDSGDDEESPHKQRQKLSQDPLVQMAVEVFNGQVGDIRIGPRSRK